MHALRRAGAGFWRHNTLDSAAALTFFSVLSFVPALLALVALLTQVGQGQATTAWIMSLLERAAPEDVVTLLEQPIARLTQVSGAGYVAVVSVALAIWSASTYVAAFGRAMNGLYEVAEGRPLWKIIPYNLLLTVLMLLMDALRAGTRCDACAVPAWRGPDIGRLKWVRPAGGQDVPGRDCRVRRIKKGPARGDERGQKARYRNIRLFENAAREEEGCNLSARD